jgi:zinc D-Ala-D-Ala dipeptidase
MLSSLRLAAPLIVLVCIVACSIERRSAIVETPGLKRLEDYDLVDLRTYAPDVAVDLRYATAQNVAKQVLYPVHMPCLLRRKTADKLLRAQAALKEHGVSLRVWDAWRPAEVQHTLMAKGGSTGMFLNPKVAWSQHCQGTAVDVTLVDLEGRELALPTQHDDNSVEAYYQYSGSDPAVKANVGALQRAMEDAGFALIDSEWWHFNDAAHVARPLAPIYARDLGIRLPEVR